MVIYLISNIVNGKVYVGQHQGVDLNHRWRQHVKTAQLGSKLAFHKAIRKYGADSFSVTLLSTASSKTDLDEQEIRLIREYRAMNPAYGYNMTPGGQTGGMHGKHQTEHQKQRVRETQTGRHPSVDTRKKMSLAAKNRPPCSESLRQKRREFAKGNKNAEGLRHSEIFKLQQGERVKNSRWLNDEKNDKLVRTWDLDRYLAEGWKLGRVFHSRAPHSEITKEKMKARWKLRKEHQSSTLEE